MFKPCRASSGFMGTVETMFQCITSRWFTSLSRGSAFISFDCYIYTFTGNIYNKGNIIIEELKY